LSILTSKETFPEKFWSERNLRVLPYVFFKKKEKMRKNGKKNKNGNKKM
jgi:hypothetical protein